MHINDLHAAMLGGRGPQFLDVIFIGR